MGDKLQVCEGKKKMKGYRFLIGFCLAVAFVTLSGTTLAGQAAPQADPGINKVYLTDVRDVSFVVSWTTNLPSDGKVEWGTTAALGNTLTDSVLNTTTHYVRIEGLSELTPYYYRVVSGTATRDNGGVPFQVTTGPTVSVPPPGKQVRGYVYESNGSTVVPNAIVYLQLQDANASGSPGNSQWVSARASASGTWSYVVNNARTADASDYFVYTEGADNLRIVGQGGEKGTKGVDPAIWTIVVPTTTPFTVPVVLDGAPTAITLSKFGVASPGNTGLLFGATLAGAALLGLLWVSRRRQLG